MNFTKWGATLGEMKRERWPETRDFHSGTADNELANLSQRRGSGITHLSRRD
jgi:hypothetical protein